MKLQTILFATDFSEIASHAFDYALVVARERDARLHVLHVAPSGPRGARPYAPDASLAALAEGYEGLASEAERGLVDLARRAGKVATERAMLRGGDPAAEIVAHASRCSADLVVLGTHGRRAMARLVLGSVAAEVVRHAPCPVLGVRQAPEAEPPSLSRALVPVDFSPESERALVAAAELVRPQGGRLEILHVIEQIPRPEAYRGVLGGFDILEEAEGIRSHCERTMAEMAARVEGIGEYGRHVLHGPVVGEIRDFLTREPADLVAVGRHGVGGASELLLGSTAERLLRTAPCPVLTVP